MSFKTSVLLVYSTHLAKVNSKQSFMPYKLDINVWGRQETLMPGEDGTFLPAITIRARCAEWDVFSLSFSLIKIVLE